MGKPGRAVRAAGWVAVGVVAAGGVATAATSTSSSSKTAAVTTAASTATTPAAGKHAKRGALGKLEGRLLHGQATVLGKDNKPVQVAEQRGTVAAVSPTSISLTSTDGFKQTYVVSATTRVRIDGKKTTIADVKVGQKAAVLAKVDGSTQNAVLVIERAAKAKPAA